MFVKYATTHNMLQEWIYNRADIDAAKVVWARFMSPAKNRQLIDYFSDHKVWLLEPDVAISLQPYSP